MGRFAGLRYRQVVTRLKTLGFEHPFSGDRRAQGQDLPALTLSDLRPPPRACSVAADPEGESRAGGRQGSARSLDLASHLLDEAGVHPELHRVGLGAELALAHLIHVASAARP
jgi:hypothetical protein